jgi:hypothetical protein
VIEIKRKSRAEQSRAEQSRERDKEIKNEKET